jgi:hypothetical protein
MPAAGNGLRDAAGTADDPLPFLFAPLDRPRGPPGGAPEGPPAPRTHLFSVSQSLFAIVLHGVFCRPIAPFGSSADRVARSPRAPAAALSLSSTASRISKHLYLKYAFFFL